MRKKAPHHLECNRAGWRVMESKSGGKLNTAAVSPTTCNPVLLSPPPPATLSSCLPPHLQSCPPVPYPNEKWGNSPSRLPTLQHRGRNHGPFGRILRAQASAPTPAVSTPPLAAPPSTPAGAPGNSGSASVSAKNSIPSLFVTRIEVRRSPVTFGTVLDISSILS